MVGEGGGAVFGREGRGRVLVGGRGADESAGVLCGVFGGRGGRGVVGEVSGGLGLLAGGLGGYPEFL